MHEMETRSQEIATSAHAGQLRMDHKTKYIDHPAQVVALLHSWGIKDPFIISAAWLHDVIEDTSVTKEDIEIQVNKKVATIVWELTRRNTEYPSGKGERLIAYRKQLRGASKEAQWIKIADIMSNLQDFIHLDVDGKTLRYMRQKKFRDLNAVITGAIEV